MRRIVKVNPRMAVASGTVASRTATLLAFVSVPGVSSIVAKHTVVDGEQVILTVGDELVCIDLPSRAEVWRKPANARERLSADVVAAQLTDQYLALRDGEGREQWRARFRPFIYDVARMTNGTVLVATAGRGGYVYVVNADMGEVRSRTKVPGGASSFVHSSPADGQGDGHVLASGWKALARIDLAGNVTIWKVRDAFRVVWARGADVALLTNPPRPGIAFVTCR